MAAGGLTLRGQCINLLTIGNSVDIVRAFHAASGDVMQVDSTAEILRLADRDTSVSDIADHLALTPGRVYTVLRQHRPDRPRKSRRETSELRPKILGLHDRGIKPSRIAFLLECSRAYVYRILDAAGAEY